MAGVDEGRGSLFRQRAQMLSRTKIDDTARGNIQAEIMERRRKAPHPFHDPVVGLIHDQVNKGVPVFRPDHLIIGDGADGCPFEIEAFGG